MSENNKYGIRSLDELFTTQEERDDAKREKVMELPIGELRAFPNHPFMIREDQDMEHLVDSIRQYGVHTPLLVRPAPDGNGYEIVSGHRRSQAAKNAGLEMIPAIVRELTDDEAIIVMVDANLQRETILPSEKAFAYKMKMEAMKRKAGRPDKNSRQLGANLNHSRTTAMLGEAAGDSSRMVERYIRLTNLIPELLSEVDQSRIGLSPAVELSFLPENEQTMLLSAIEYAGVMPSMKQAKQIKKYSQAGKITPEVLEVIMNEDQVKQPSTFRLRPSEKVLSAMHRSFGELSPEEMENRMLGILERWADSQERKLSKGAR